MFVHFDESKQQKPIKIWLEDVDQVDEGCLRQVINLSNLPFIHKWAALMPDCHEGYGMPIGGVIAADGVIIPNAVGVDIGCGICFVQTDVPAETLQIDTGGQGKLIQAITGQILRSVPTGFKHHKKKRHCTVLDRAASQFPREHLVPKLVPELDSGYYQVGTLGGGNHFIEIQEDEDGLTGLMVHSGSRNFGFKVCNYFNKLAKGLNKQWDSPVPASYDLAIFPTIGGHTVYNWALRYVKTMVVSVSILGEPVGATILAFLIFNEAPGPMQLLGGLVIIAGIFIFLTAARSENSKAA
jgi:tRNA-splicing ligase RtcB